MTAMREAARFFKIDKGEFLHEQDGKALWTDFPKETDWFMQDNQIHGEWGADLYDAWKDFSHYLDPNRDATLEQKLIENVLSEIDAPDLQKKLEQLKKRKRSPDDSEWLELYVEACGIRRKMEEIEAENIAQYINEVQNK